MKDLGNSAINISITISLVISVGRLVRQVSRAGSNSVVLPGWNCCWAGIIQYMERVTVQAGPSLAELQRDGLPKGKS